MGRAAGRTRRPSDLLAEGSRARRTTLTANCSKFWSPPRTATSPCASELRRRDTMSATQTSTEKASYMPTQVTNTVVRGTTGAGRSR